MDNFKKSIKNDSNIVAAFLYGSRVYGTHTEQSDYDFICIVKNKEVYNPLTQFGDVTNYTEEEFNNLICKHEISVLECVFLDESFIVKKSEDFNFNLNKQELRNSISAKASNSWVKCKKKFIVEEDFNPYVGKKSAWHSLRILDFGKQIADNGKIVNYGSCNHLQKELMELKSWGEIEQKFKPIYNNMSSAFKQSAPKDVQPAKPKM